MGERFLFFGSIGFCLVIALLLEKWVGNTAAGTLAIIKNPKVLAVVIPLTLAYTAIAVNRNTDWYSNYTLYGADIHHSPNSGKLNYFYGLELEKVVAYAEKDPVKQKEIRLDGINYLEKAVS